MREDTLMDELHEVVSGVKAHNFQLQLLKPHMKDGGVFVKFQYDADAGSAVEDITQELRERMAKAGGVPSWMGWPRGSVWPVKGSPWLEVRTCQMF